MTEVERLIEKHRAHGVLIDANLLILCLVGRTNRRRIANFDRTSSFSVHDYDVLEQLIAPFRRIVTTPRSHEVSNLANKLQLGEQTRLRELLKHWIDGALEIYETSSHIATDPAFKRFGLTDAAIASLCRRDKLLLLTVDVPLYGALTNRGFDAINFRHIQYGYPA